MCYLNFNERYLTILVCITLVCQAQPRDPDASSMLKFQILKFHVMRHNSFVLNLISSDQSLKQSGPDPLDFFTDAAADRRRNKFTDIG